MAQQYQQQYNPNPWAVPHQGQAQPNFFVPQVPLQGPGPPSGGAPAAFGGVDPFLSGVAGNVLRQQGQSYLQRSQAFVQSKMGFLSGGTMQYLFNVTPEYVRTKLFMLGAPFLRKWTYTRITEQLSGGHKFQPPSRDHNAPDLYLPVMSLWTYCILVGVALFGGNSFKPEIVYNTVSSALGAWALHTFLLKLFFWVLGIPSSAPLLELAAYAGYSFIAASVAILAQMAIGGMVYHVVWAYSSMCMAIFLVRTLKRVIFQEAQHYSSHATRHNYLLLGLAVFQFPFIAWLSRLPVGARG